MVVDCEMDGVPAGSRVVSPMRSNTGDSMPDTVDFSQALGVDVKQLAGHLTFIPNDWFDRLEIHDADSALVLAEVRRRMVAVRLALAGAVLEGGDGGALGKQQIVSHRCALPPFCRSRRLRECLHQRDALPCSDQLETVEIVRLGVDIGHA